MLKVNYKLNYLPYKPTIIVKKLSGNNFSVFVTYEEYASKIRRIKIGTTSVYLLVKFKMATKSAIKINKCHMLALV